MKCRVLFVAVTICLLAVFFNQTANAVKWEPYQFKGNEKYEFRIISSDDGKQLEAYYALEIKKSGKKDSAGEDLFEVTYTTRGEVPESKLGAETAFGLWGFYGVSLAMVFVNPAYSFFFTQLDLVEGGNMNFYGAGTVRVTGKETVGGREGFVCKLSQPGDEGEQLITEWTVDPNLALPIKSILYDEGEVQNRIELIKYTQY